MVPAGPIASRCPVERGWEGGRPVIPGVSPPANCGTVDRTAQVWPESSDSSRPPPEPVFPAAAYTRPGTAGENSIEEILYWLVSVRPVSAGFQLLPQSSDR